jgi:cytochrome b561
MEHRKRSAPTRLLHFLLAAAVLNQLFGSLVMHRPRPPSRAGDFAFDVHEYVGLASMGVIILFWLWGTIRQREHGLGSLFPWFSAKRLAAVAEDFGAHARALARLRLPMPAEETPLASAVHGLGLLTATVMAVTGTIVYTQMAPDGALTDFGRQSLTLHHLLANLMWAYLIGHAALAVLHQLYGHRVLQRMFSV